MKYLTVADKKSVWAVTDHIFIDYPNADVWPDRKWVRFVNQNLKIRILFLAK